MCGGSGRASGLEGVDGGADGTALVVAEHDDERNVEHGDGVLERADHRVGDHLTRVANHEQVAESLVEDDLGRQPGVAAAEQGRVRRLRAGELLAPLDILTRMLRLAGDEALVAADHLPPDLGGRASRAHESSSAVDGCRERRELGVARRAGQHESRLVRPSVTSA